MSSEYKPGKCPLCGHTAPARAESLPAETIKECWKALGITLSPESLPGMEDGKLITFWECGKCEFGFSDPSLAGNAHFYKELQEKLPGYYPQDSPEYHRTIAFAKENGIEEVLDVGCGSGSFLDLARRAGLRTYGMELNPKGAEVSRSKGHEVFNMLMGDFLKTNSKRFPLVTSFQVIEHVPDPIGFIREVRELMTDGGYFSMAVPNQDGVHRLCPAVPHMWPPHHVGRWKLQTLRVAADITNLNLLRSGADKLLGSEANYFWHLNNRLSSISGHRPHPGGKILPAVLCFFYRKSGAKYWFPNKGSSIYGFFTR